jgi:hypothetical protein
MFFELVSKNDEKIFLGKKITKASTTHKVLESLFPFRKLKSKKQFALRFFTVKRKSTTPRAKL